MEGHHSDRVDHGIPESVPEAGVVGQGEVVIQPYEWLLLAQEGPLVQAHPEGLQDRPEGEHQEHQCARDDEEKRRTRPALDRAQHLVGSIRS